MSFGLNQNFIGLDPQMEALASELDVMYISPKRILCNENGCLTFVPASDFELIQWDFSHLTVAGSIFLVENFGALKN